MAAAAERPSQRRAAVQRRRRNPLLPPVGPATPVPPTDQPIPVPPGYGGAAGQPIPMPPGYPGASGLGPVPGMAAPAAGSASPSGRQPDWQAARDEQLWQEVEAAVAAAEELEREGRVADAADSAQSALEALEAQHGAAPLPLVVLRQFLWDLLYALVSRAHEVYACC